MDTYVMTKELFLDLISKARKLSSVYTLSQIINFECAELDVRGVSHHGYFASITDFKSYYHANIDLINFKTAQSLFDKNWPIYTRTNDSCPTQYFENGFCQEFRCLQRMSDRRNRRKLCHRTWMHHQKGAVVNNSVILPGASIGKNITVENYVIDKNADIAM